MGKRQRDRDQEFRAARVRFAATPRVSTDTLRPPPPAPPPPESHQPADAAGPAPAALPPDAARSQPATGSPRSGDPTPPASEPERPAARTPESIAQAGARDAEPPPTEKPGGLPDREWLAYDDVARHLGTCKRTISRRIEDDGFPRPVLFSPGGRAGVLRFRRSDVAAYVARKERERDARLQK